MLMPRIRLPVTLISRYFPGLTSPSAHNFHRSLTTGSDPQLRVTELKRAATPIDGCDYNHWLVVMDPPIGYPLRHQIVERYLQTLASALGSEEEAKRSMYSVSTMYYYAFGCNIGENVIGVIKSMPGVRWVLPDSHIRHGEPITDGCVAPYEEMFHEDWLLDRSDIVSRRRIQKRRSRKKEQKMNSN
ncbi:multiple organellar RNA editing factor 7, mitochondrial-like isoform X2 [Rutidosis leptorrhynchoides]|uniref:multiple organellar RNA editing factor 7, mitochondrial-like isoform X2 n=1 Tax=Rutidosis leptorrhynchoides TaxID=125765 RepID=UPI003A98D16F